MLSHGAERNNSKTEKQRNYSPILQEATCDNYLIVKCLLKSNVAKVILLTYFFTYSKNCKKTNITWLYFYLHISVRIFCILFLCFVLDDLFAIDLFSNFLFQTLNYALSCWFHCVDMLYIKFRFIRNFHSNKFRD